MLYYGAVKDGQIVECTVAKTKKESKNRLVELLTWSNCFDTIFKPSKDELAAYTIEPLVLRIKEIE